MIETQVAIISYSHLFDRFPSFLVRNNLNAIALLESYLGVHPINGLINTKGFHPLIISSQIYCQPTIICEKTIEGLILYPFPLGNLETKIKNPGTLDLVSSCADIYQHNYFHGVIPLLVNFAPEPQEKYDDTNWALLGIIGKSIKFQQYYTCHE